MKINKNKLTSGNIKQPIGLTILGGVSVYLILIILITMIPFPSWSYFCLSGIFGVLGFSCHVWIRVKPNLYARFLLDIAISGIFMLLAWRTFSYLFPQIANFGILGISLLTIFSHSLPMWNNKLANNIRDELYAPKTQTGKILYKLSLGFLILVAVITGIVVRIQTDSYVFIVLLLISILMVTIMPFSHRSPSSPWERDLTAKKYA